ncbi:4-hydroxybenzoate transporter [Paraburkholderia phytofirmans OLGA172]|uniref:4-hydroxybenzoate transporter n=1 Tax=Paraburkholderia phytofirmans OLGA172 TaxID=1417228 RepID=A0A161I262_9BURK|nr:MFS transporter [Paraburkholderia phytofirmans]ANB72983.1 4-hydroxybenzoate transporter [Paraburkholderia phytofirmans OLGA172]
MKSALVVDVQEFINEHPFGRFRRLIFFMCFVIVLLDGFDAAAIGFIAPSLMTEWHLAKPDLVPVLSAALFGLAFGALVSGPLSDRVGRRSLMLGSVVLFGVASVASAFSTNLVQLTVLRFITGIGLGAAMANAVTMMDEFCTTRRRATVTSLMCCGFPLGAACGGLIAAWLVPQAGWRSVLMLGGVAPILHSVLLLLKMPESVRFMVANHKPVARIRAVLVRIADEAINARGFTLSESAPETGDNGLGLVLSRSYIVGSLMLWLAAFMGLLIIYALINWMPILLKDAGLSLKSATLISALFPLGGVGAVLCGALMDRFNANVVVAACYALAAISLFCIGATAGHIALLVPIVLVSGVLMNTAQASMNALAATFYPTEGRGTGVAWMLGMARFGGIAGSFLVAELVRWHFTLVGVFATIAVAGALACVALLVKQLAPPHVFRTAPDGVGSLSH